MQLFVIQIVFRTTQSRTFDHCLLLFVDIFNMKVIIDSADFRTGWMKISIRKSLRKVQLQRSHNDQFAVSKKRVQQPQPNFAVLDIFNFQVINSAFIVRSKYCYRRFPT